MEFSENDIGYMAAILDGEGSINFSTTGGWRACVSAVCNSNPLIISRVESILDSWGIQYVTRSTHVHFWHVDIKGRCSNKKRFLEIIFNSLSGKKEQARLMIKYMARRGDRRFVRISEMDKAIAIRVKQLNRLNRTGTVETAREAFLELVEEVKIQSELFGDKESPAEMPGPTLIKKQA
jgi:hypothetical protein